MARRTGVGAAGDDEPRAAFQAPRAEPAAGLRAARGRHWSHGEGSRRSFNDRNLTSNLGATGSNRTSVDPASMDTAPMDTVLMDTVLMDTAPMDTAP